MKLDFFLRQQRDRELQCDYITAKLQWQEEGRYFTKKELLVHVLENNRPHYHFSFEYARRMLKSVGLDGLHLCKSTLHQAMWQEIGEKVKNVRRKHPRKSLTEALCDVLVDGRASRYFLTYDYAKRIIRKTDEKGINSSRA